MVIWTVMAPRRCLLLSLLVSIAGAGCNTKLDLVLDLAAKTPGGKQAVRSMEIGPHCTLRTGTGVGVGSKPDEVAARYARRKKHFIWNRGRDMLVIGSAYGGIHLSFKGGVVTEIFVGATAE